MSETILNLLRRAAGTNNGPEREVCLNKALQLAAAGPAAQYTTPEEVEVAIQALEDQRFELRRLQMRLSIERETAITPEQLKAHRDKEQADHAAKVAADRKALLEQVKANVLADARVDFADLRNQLVAGRTSIEAKADALIDADSKHSGMAMYNCKRELGKDGLRRAVIAALKKGVGVA